MKTFSKLLIFLIVAALLLSGCTTPQPEPTPEPEPLPAPVEPDPTPTVNEAMLFAVWNEDNIEQHEFAYEGELTPVVLAAGLSTLSGLDFSITYIVQDDNSALIFWGDNSTLIAGLGDKEQKEDFFFFDIDSLNWFMLDSLYYTLKENLGYSAIYYMQEDGQPLSLQDMSPVPPIPANEPYQGSAPYRGDMA